MTRWHFFFEKKSNATSSLLYSEEFSFDVVLEDGKIPVQCGVGDVQGFCHMPDGATAGNHIGGFPEYWVADGLQGFFEFPRVDIRADVITNHKGFVVFGDGINIDGVHDCGISQFQQLFPSRLQSGFNGHSCERLDVGTTIVTRKIVVQVEKDFLPDIILIAGKNRELVNRNGNESPDGFLHVGHFVDLFKGRDAGFGGGDFRIVADGLSVGLRHFDCSCGLVERSEMPSKKEMVGNYAIGLLAAFPAISEFFGGMVS